MRPRTYLPILTLLISELAFALNGTEKTHSERGFSGFLFEDQKGSVWVAHPLVGLGMIGVSGRPPAYRLSPELAERYRPLAMQLDPKPEDGSRVSFWHWVYPRPADEGDPTILVGLHTRIRLVKGPPVGASGMPFDADRRGPERIYEIISADLLTAEFASAGWRESWDRLDQGLEDIVAATLISPSEEKRERLRTLIDVAATALTEMLRPELKDEWKETADQIDTNARVVTLDQRSKAYEWGRALETCIECLDIHPGAPLPECPESEAAKMILAEMESPEAFRAEMERVYGERWSEHPVVWENRPIYADEIANASPERFVEIQGKLSDYFKGRLERRKGSEKTKSPTSFTIEDFGFVVRPLTRQEMADKMVLGGILIEKVLPEGEQWGLRDGDAIVTVKRVYDLGGARYRIRTGLGSYDEESLKRALKAAIDRGKGSLRKGTLIIRGNEAIGIGE